VTTTAKNGIDSRRKVRLAIYYKGDSHLELVVDYRVNRHLGGFFIESARVLPVDTALSVQFMLPGKESPIVCDAKVAWINESTSMRQDLPPGMALNLLNLSLDDMHTVQDFLSNYELVPTW